MKAVFLSVFLMTSIQLHAADSAPGIPKGYVTKSYYSQGYQAGVVRMLTCKPEYEKTSLRKVVNSMVEQMNAMGYPGSTQLYSNADDILVVRNVGVENMMSEFSMDKEQAESAMQFLINDCEFLSHMFSDSNIQRVREIAKTNKSKQAPKKTTARQ